jgi:type IV pilus assembly protein PilX
MRLREYQKGMALVSALLLLLVTTMLGVAMFRSFGFLESVAGNTREKQRALHAAESAQTYAEWWLGAASGLNATIGSNCSAKITSVSSYTVCSNVLASPATIPWTKGMQYSPFDLSTGSMGTAGNYANPPPAAPIMRNTGNIWRGDLDQVRDVRARPQLVGEVSVRPLARRAGVTLK